MKISAIPAGASAGAGQNLLATASGTATPQKMAAAKAIAAGESPIQVSQSDTHVDPQVARAQDSIRKIKMRTNASPDRFNPVPEPTTTAPEGESAISDPTEQVKASIEDTKPLSPQLAALAKERRALQVKERELADREKALASKPTIDGTNDLAARIKSQPLSVLQEYGVTYDDLTAAIIANQTGSNPELQELKAELKALKEGVDKQLSDRDAQAEQQVLSEMKREAESLVKEGDAYEMVRETQSLPDVMDLILKTYKTTGEVLDVTEALRLCEEDLINESLKIARINKVKSRLTPTQEPIQQQQKQMRTLTNKDGAAPVMDRKSRAIAAMLGTLKK